jgi:hypothetical protein
MPDPVSGTIIGSTVIGAASSKSAADTQANAANRAADLQQKQFDVTNEQQRPWREAGGRALTKLEGMADYKPFDMSTFTQDPGYGFRLKQGMNALNNQAAARGGLISGNALKAATAFGQDMGSQEYNAAFNRYQTERQATLSPYMTLAGYGANANALSANAGAANAANVGNLITGGAAAQAAGTMGVANAFGGAASQYMKYDQGNNLLAAIKGNSSPSNADLVKMYMT